MSFIATSRNETKAFISFTIEMQPIFLKMSVGLPRRIIARYRIKNQLLFKEEVER